MSPQLSYRGVRSPSETHGRTTAKREAAVAQSPVPVCMATAQENSPRTSVQTSGLDFFSPPGEDFRQVVIAEFRAQRASHREALHEQASDLRQEFIQTWVEQSKVFNEHMSALRRESEMLVRIERDARVWDSSELRSEIKRLHDKVAEVQAELVTSMLYSRSAAQAPQQPLPQHGWHQALDKLAHSVQAECQARCARDAELHNRLGRELSDLTQHLEEVRMGLSGEMEDVVNRAEAQWALLKLKLEHEHSDRNRESNELRAILDSVWQASRRQKSSDDPLGKSSKVRDTEEACNLLCKEGTGETEDINTLYEMVREALGDTTQLRAQMHAERRLREADRHQAERLERQVRTVQAIMHNMMPPGAPTPAPLDASSIASSCSRLNSGPQEGKLSARGSDIPGKAADVVVFTPQTGSRLSSSG